jgi:hypothetical protein
VDGAAATGAMGSLGMSARCNAKGWRVVNLENMSAVSAANQILELEMELLTASGARSSWLAHLERASLRSQEGRT